MKKNSLVIIIVLVVILFVCAVVGLLMFGNKGKTKSSENKETTQADNCIDHGQVLQVVDDYVCCAGLTAETFCFMENDSAPQCSCPSEGTKLCINCGDGVCGPGEDECMCPEDCT